MREDPQELYDDFIGSWEVESSLKGRGEWHFAPILGGRAIQDVIYPLGAARSSYGTTLRSFDAASRLWHIFYTAPGDGEFTLLVGRRDGDRIVQRGHDLTDPSRHQKWSFLDLSRDSFRWTGELSIDGGNTWTLAHEMLARRRAAAPPRLPL